MKMIRERGRTHLLFSFLNKFLLNFLKFYFLISFYFLFHFESANVGSASVGPHMSVRKSRSAKVGPQVRIRKCRSACVGPQVRVRKCRLAEFISLN